MTVEILIGDAGARLRELPADSVHCCVTSPPYWGLRDYGASGQIGLELTPDAWAARLVEVFREVRRVLRPDGTLWLNVGDSYASSPPGNKTVGVSAKSGLHGVNGESGRYRETLAAGHATKLNTVIGDLKPKDLIGQPWLLAFALRADGWWLRSEIIWAKPNPMPESVNDRPTKSHEQIFLLTKSASYFYDQEAVRESLSDVSLSQIEHFNKNGARDDLRPKPLAPDRGNGDKGLQFRGAGTRGAAMNPAGRNARSVWTIATEPYSEAHFATFPSELARRCILAGTSAKGCCPQCAAPWARVVESSGGILGRGWGNGSDAPDLVNRPHRPGSDRQQWDTYHRETTGWRATCACDAGEPVPATVLDPFGGAGTTGLAAQQTGRDAILIELNPEYAAMARKRIDGARARRLIGDVADAPRPLPGQMGLAL